MQVSVTKNNGVPIYKQIASQIEAAIRGGDLPHGFILPPERKLADQLDVNRTTVLNAYRKLKDTGLVTSKVGQGTMVIKAEGDLVLKKEAIPMYYQHLFSKRCQREMSDFEKSLLSAVGHEDLIQFGVGIIKSPMDDYFQDAMEEVIAEEGVTAIRHTPYTGLERLKEAVANHLKTIDLVTKASEVMIVSGSQQGIDLAGDVFINEGDVVLVEEPTYFFATQAFRSKGAKVIGIPMTPEGMDMHYLEQVLRSTRVKLIYTMPNYQNPTNYNMSMAGKTKLLQLAYEHQCILLEDGAYNDLAFEGSQPVTLKSLDYNNQVVYIGTFSKVLSMGPRIGYVVAHQEIRDKMTYLKHLSDLHSASISQWFMIHLLERGALDQVKAKLAKEHMDKYKVFLRAYKALGFEDLGVSIRPISGGIYLWMTFDTSMDSIKLLDVARKEGVTFVPGRLFSVDGRLNNAIRINYVYESEVGIEKGLRRLKKAIEAIMAEKRGGKTSVPSDALAIL